MRIVLVEDNQQLATTIADGLSEDGYAVDVVGSAAGAIDRGMRRDMDLMVLDLGLPDRDGLEVLNELRNARINVPILVLTARDAVEGRVAALHAGADDYLVKPFAFEELVARLHALARRPAETHADVLEHAGVRVDPQARRASANGSVLQLTPREFALLELLLRHRGRVFPRTDILERIAGGESEASDRSIEVVVFGLRRKLADAGCDGLIENRRGAGYLIP